MYCIKKTQTSSSDHDSSGENTNSFANVGFGLNNSLTLLFSRFAIVRARLELSCFLVPNTRIISPCSAILLLINEGQTVYQKIKEKISPEDFKDERNKKIVSVLYEELEKGDISNVIGLFEKDEQIVSHITYILSKELDISDVDKAIDDLVNKFLKEKLLEEKSIILKKLVSGNLNSEETLNIENRLKEISKRLVSIK